ncbi:hypothetical protein NPIL_382671 [Nephila pilipes]|uniref:Uncharacterized protein n=1 Tax=Nephila pilipes TaxID=299642 RepID=A0A8X6P4R3_NEPPI|nr:hypothetical protein NPIL_382671 [Nephila pilipes]
MIQCVFDVPVSCLQFRSRPLNQESDFTSLVSIHIDSGIAFRPGTDLKLLPKVYSPRTEDQRLRGWEWQIAFHQLAFEHQFRLCV